MVALQKVYKLLMLGTGYPIKSRKGRQIFATPCRRFLAEVLVCGTGKQIDLLLLSHQTVLRE